MATSERLLGGMGDSRFISYAQNFEDVMLWRALGRVRRGFYVDIGAQHPVVDSVSKAFYDRGWKGVHVEPVHTYAELLRADRPDEEVLEIAISDREGVLELFEIPGTGLSTAVESIAKEHAASGYESVIGAVPCMTLDALLTTLGDRDVHWLKIDVEGYEARVLDGWRAVATRPWIVVIESTSPLSNRRASEDWEAKILKLGYRHAYFDGLNRFYVSHGHPELMDALITPPNVFDRFVLSGFSSFGIELGRKVNALSEVATELESARAGIADREAKVVKLEENLASARERAQQISDAVHLLELEVMKRDSSIVGLETALALAQVRADGAEESGKRLELEIMGRDASIARISAHWEAEQQRTSRLDAVRRHLEQAIGQRDDSIAKLETAIAGWVNRTRAAQSRADHIELLYQSIEGSRSWRFTAPLRGIAHRCRSLFGRIETLVADFSRLPRWATRTWMLAALIHLRAHPGQRVLVERTARQFPPLHRALRAIAARHMTANVGDIGGARQPIFRGEASRLSIGARDLARRLDYVKELESRIDQLEQAIRWDESVQRLNDEGRTGIISVATADS